MFYQTVLNNPSSFEDEIFSYGNKKFKYSKTAFFDRAKYIRESFNKEEYIHAYPVKEMKDRMIIEIENIGFYTVKIDRVSVGDEVTQVNKILIPHASNASPEFKNFEIKCPITHGEIIVDYHIIGGNETRQTKVFKWKRKVE